MNTWPDGCSPTHVPGDCVKVHSPVSVEDTEERVSFDGTKRSLAADWGTFDVGVSAVRFADSEREKRKRDTAATLETFSPVELIPLNQWTQSHF